MCSQSITANLGSVLHYGSLVHVVAQEVGMNLKHFGEKLILSWLLR